ncbi:adenylosuccinate synthetase [Helicobacter heilmannii]|uniref:adenylosuccinate synthetase n=1 Tax=Helicobacter heilmannii TaxID=35817 RepID=UPI0025555239|nr:adenylosuccinate synthetase [Helicobacter heilmannii]
MGGGQRAGVGEFNALPKEAQEYILALQELIGVKIGAVSTSPQRENMVLLP